MAQLFPLTRAGIAGTCFRAPDDLDPLNSISPRDEELLCRTYELHVLSETQRLCSSSSLART
jgi:hypothetical protein